MKFELFILLLCYLFAEQSALRVVVKTRSPNISPQIRSMKQISLLNERHSFKLHSTRNDLIEDRQFFGFRNFFAKSRAKILKVFSLKKFFGTLNHAAAHIALCLALCFAHARPAVAAGSMQPRSQQTIVAPARHKGARSSRTRAMHTQIVAHAETAATGVAVVDDDDDGDVSPTDNEAVVEVKREVKRSLRGLIRSMQGAKLDSLIVLLVTSAVVPIFKRLNMSPIIGFLLFGTLMGPTGLNWVKDIHLIDVIGELGIIFFLFEMGLELSFERLMQMRRDVFGLGTCQFLVTSLLGAAVGTACGLPIPAAVTIGGSLSLSSSAFVLELLKDKKALGTRHGKASFGILLLQDLAVVPLLVIVDLLSKGGTGLARALTLAGMKALVTLSAMSALGRGLLNPIFYFVSKSDSQEAFLSIILSTVLLMSFVTQGVGLSDTLGAFLAGLLLSETKFRYQIESDIAPFRGLLLGIFFITVGFSIDINLLFREAPTIFAMLVSLLVGKASVITALSMMFGMSFAQAQQCGLLNAQGGEFAFVAFGIAERTGLIPKPLAKKLLTTVALSMALTPLLADLGSFFSSKLEEKMDFSRVTHRDSEVRPDAQDFVLVCGYGRVGKMVCEMLDQNLVRYVAIDKRPNKALDARTKGLPVFVGDISRPEVLSSFDASAAKACVIALTDVVSTNKAVVALRKLSPTLPIIVRAKDAQHQKRLESMFDGVYAMSPVLPEDSVLLSIPFGGVVLQKIGVSRPAIDAVMDEFRKTYMEGKNFDDDTFDFLETFRKRLPSSEPEAEQQVIASVGDTPVMESIVDVSEIPPVEAGDSSSSFTSDGEIVSADDGNTNSYESNASDSSIGPVSDS